MSEGRCVLRAGGGSAASSAAASGAAAPPSSRPRREELLLLLLVLLLVVGAAAAGAAVCGWLLQRARFGRCCARAAAATVGAIWAGEQTQCCTLLVSIFDMRLNTPIVEVRSGVSCDFFVWCCAVLISISSAVFDWQGIGSCCSSKGRVCN